MSSFRRPRERTAGSRTKNEPQRHRGHRGRNTEKDKKSLPRLCEPPDETLLSFSVFLSLCPLCLCRSFLCIRDGFMAFQILHAENLSALAVSTPILNPAEAEVHFAFDLREEVQRPELRGRLTGPRCPYATTVEIAYPVRPLPGPR